MKPKTCFVIMPVSKTSKHHTDSYWKTFYEDQIKAHVENFQHNGHRYICQRLSDCHGSIKDGLIQNLIKADAVITILTDYNLNVIYELGMRHSIKPGTLILMEGKRNNKIPKRFPSDLHDCWIRFYQDNSGQNFLKDDIEEFLLSYESDPYKSCMPYKTIRQLTIPYDEYIPNGFQAVEVPEEFFEINTICNILLINVHKHIFSLSMQRFIKKSPSTINLLYTTNEYVQLTRAMSLRKSMHDYNHQSGHDSSRYIAEFLAANEKTPNTRNAQTYHEYPFGLYLQINNLIWFTPLWNMLENNTTSAYDNMCLQMTLESDFGQMLYANFKFLWKHTGPMPHSASQGAIPQKPTDRGPL